MFRGLFQRKKYLKMRDEIVRVTINLQSIFRMVRTRLKYQRAIKAIKDQAMTKIKKFTKGYLNFQRMKGDIRRVAYRGLLERQMSVVLLPL